MQTKELVPMAIGFIITLVMAVLVYRYYRKRENAPAERYHTFGPRFWSPSIDSALLWPVTVLLPLILSYIFPGLQRYFQLLATLAFYAYSIYFHGTYGGTIGKLKCNIQVVDAKTELPIGYVHAFKRDAIPLFFSVAILIQQISAGDESLLSLWSPSTIFLLWFLAEIITMLTNQKRRAIHDFIAGTVVVRPTGDSREKAAMQAG